MTLKGLQMMQFDINTDAIEGLGQSLEITLSKMSDISSLAPGLLDEIGQEGVKMARSFLRSNSNHHPGVYKGRYLGTGELFNSVTYSVEKSQLKLSAPARDYRGKGYAGYIEYGFTDRGGSFTGPWPFMRPALQMMVLATRGKLGNSAASALQGLGGTGLLAKSSGRIGIGSKNLGRIHSSRTDATRDRYARTARGSFGSTADSKSSWKGTAPRSHSQQVSWAQSSSLPNSVTSRYTR